MYLPSMCKSFEFKWLLNESELHANEVYLSGDLVVNIPMSLLTGTCIFHILALGKTSNVNLALS